jgi:hypothetical protein
LTPDDPLWQRIAAHHIGPPDAALSFAQRLARENRWTLPYAERVIGEYRRFCYLAMTAGHEVTPSDQVDQAWHLHLTYSRDYWEVFCSRVLGKPLHHGPTAAGAAEKARYYEQYAQTLRSYEAAFGPVPADVWSPAAERFGRHPQAFRVLSDAVLLWRTRRGWAALAFFALALLAAGFVLGRTV